MPLWYFAMLHHFFPTWYVCEGNLQHRYSQIRLLYVSSHFSLLYGSSIKFLVGRLFHVCLRLRHISWNDTKFLNQLCVRNIFRSFLRYKNINDKMILCLNIYYKKNIAIWIMKLIFKLYFLVVWMFLMAIWILIWK